jgi:sulfotransferase family protein
MRQLTFIVGTGRSGSTALSRIVRAHTGILSLNEFLSCLGVPDIAFPRKPISGDAFWKLLSDTENPLTRLFRSGVTMEEFLYSRNPGRFSRETGIPRISWMVLPHLTDDPDGLLDELERSVMTWPRRTPPEHYEALFELLRTRFDKRVVVERSGFSLHWVPCLREGFPRARFVHLHRNGPDCALSMSRHAGFRLIALRREIVRVAGVQRLEDLTGRQLEALPPHLAGLLAPQFDPKLIWEADLPLAGFGALWSELIGAGLAALAEVPAAQRMAVAYEDILDAPDRELSRLAAFVGETAPAAWLDEARAMLDPSRRGLARQLPPPDRAALEEACAPGMQALAAAR